MFIPILGRFSFWHIFFRLKPPTREQFVLWCGICCLCLFRMQKPQLCKTWIVEGFSSSFTNQIRFGARILCTFLFFSDALGCGFKIDTWISSYVLAIAMFDNLQLLSTFLDTMIHLDFVHFVTTWTDLRLLWLTFSRTLVILLLLSFTMRLKEWVLQCFSILHFKIQRTLSLIAPSFRHFGLRGYAKVPSVKYVLNSDDCGFVPSIPSTIRYKIERVFDSSNQRRYLLNCLLVIHMFSRDGINYIVTL